MTGDKRVIEALHGLLRSELIAVLQYSVHSAIAANWGYGALSARIRARAIQEMQHADRLIDRLLFLDSNPDVSGISLGQGQIGSSIPTAAELDLALELKAIEQYNAAIAICLAADDNGTRALLTGILADEESHVSDLESGLVQIRQASVGPYLAAMIGGHES